MNTDARTPRPALAALAAVLIAMLLPGPSANAATAACAGRSASGNIVTRFRTFTVTAKPLKPSSRLGTTAKIEVTVTRPGEEDPLNNGIPLNSPVALPAEGVNVSVGLYAGNFYMYGVGITDSDGKAIVPVKLDPRAPAGTVIGEVGARKFYNQGGCPDIEEEGFAYYPKFFKATR
ncbi:MAG: hypothetical protein ACLGIB_07745 [Actinomycetota bacterium]